MQACHDNGKLREEKDFPSVHERSLKQKNIKIGSKQTYCQASCGLVRGCFHKKERHTQRERSIKVINFHACLLVQHVQSDIEMKLTSLINEINHNQARRERR